MKCDLLNGCEPESKVVDAINSNQTTKPSRAAILFKQQKCCFFFRTAGSILGAGFDAFISDWDKISATVSYKLMDSQ